MVTRCSTSSADAPGMLAKHIQHRYDSLRFLFSRRLPDAEQPQQQCSHDHERRKRRIDKRVCDFSCQPPFHECFSPSVGDVVVFFPSSSWLPGFQDHDFAFYRPETPQPDCLYFFPASQRASGTGPRRPRHKFRAVGRGSPASRSATKGPLLSLRKSVRPNIPD